MMLCKNLVMMFTSAVDLESAVEFSTAVLATSLFTLGEYPLKMILEWDTCFTVADRYILAMAFLYLKKTNMPFSSSRIRGCCLPPCCNARALNRSKPIRLKNALGHHNLSYQFLGVQRENDNPERISRNMSLRRWNSVAIPGSSTDIAHEDAETSNLIALRQLTRSSPSVNKRRKMEAETSDGSARSDEEDLQLVPTKNKARQKKFMVHFEKKEPVLEYYSCALAAEILLQGYLYITKSHLGFYSNVFGRITKILIEIKEVEKVTKANTAFIFPNAIQIHTKSERYTFGSFIFREAALHVLNQVIGHNRDSIRKRRQTQKLRLSLPPSGEVDADSESPNDQADDTDQTPPPPSARRVSLSARRRSNAAIISTTAATVHVQRKPPPKKLIYALVILVIFFGLSAVNLYIRISRLVNESSIEMPPAPDDQITNSFKDWEVTHDAGVDNVLSIIDQNLKRIRHASAALEKLKADYDVHSNGFFNFKV